MSGRGDEQRMGASSISDRGRVPGCGFASPAENASKSAPLVPPALEVRGLSCGYSGRPILENVSFSLPEGGILVLLGPNGVGKTTLFKTMLGFLPSLGGEVRIEGQDASHWTRSRFARSVAYVPQTHDAAFGFAVRDMVLMGRTPGIEGFRSPSRDDERVADDVMEALDLTRLADRDCTTLSGGELQMVLVARALAQQPTILVMDEPCANLDLGNQALLLERISELAEQGLSVIVTSHDPNHAFLLDAGVACIGRDKRVVSGRARDILTSEFLGTLYGIEVGVGAITGSQRGSVLACSPMLSKGRADV